MARSDGTKGSIKWSSDLKLNEAYTHKHPHVRNPRHTQHFETVLRLFRFENQTQGDTYLRANHPVFFVKSAGDSQSLDHSPTLIPTRPYKDRHHKDSVDENPHAEGMGVCVLCMCVCLRVCLRVCQPTPPPFPPPKHTDLRPRPLLSKHSARRVDKL